MRRAIETFAVRDNRPGYQQFPRVTSVGELFADADPLVLAYPQFFKDARA